MLIIPPLFQTLITEHRWQGAILILAGFVANIGVCAALYRPTPLEIKARGHNYRTNDYQEVDHKEPTKSSIDSCFSSVIAHGDLILFKNIYFKILLAANILYGFSYVISFHYVPVRAVATGTSELNAAYLLSAIGVGSCVTRVTHGFIIDHHILSATVLTSIAYFVCGVSCILILISDEYPFLATFAVFIGLSSGVYNSTIPTVAKEYVGLHHVSGGVAWMLLMCGVGVLIGAYSTGKYMFTVNISSTNKGAEGNLTHY